MSKNLFNMDLLEVTPNVYPTIDVGLVNSSRYWDKVELCSVPALSGIKEPFCTVNKHIDSDIVKCFGTDEPEADNYILHYSSGWNTNRNKYPLLLVHGAGLDANSYTNLYGLGFEGLQQKLVKLGYRVFAITFSHSHGNNFYQAEQLCAAINKIKKETKCEQVDIVAHSKGGIPVQIYLSSLGYNSYQGDVRSYLMLGTPNYGIDYLFRNPLLNYFIYTLGANGVIVWDKIMSFATVLDVTERSIYKEGYFPGQAQIAYRWDETYPLDTLQQDWWTTYYGGSGLLGNSQGIDKAIRDGGFLIKRLNNKGLEPGINIATLAGNNVFEGVAFNVSGPSDGLVFIDSALYTDGMTKRGAKLLDKTILPLNHMELLYDNRVARWIDMQLSNK
ncbi:esterase/lipase family protein [Candidatus Syntrophocurvum alkaliphilum]|uniref:esterase/lipase family protein n=1 Tax=Candidatus Syntrophocurvum alkaliphilum TaxID=2293317 RepID=UPI0012E138BF|nr:alpha/beta hydrolase [Candidatus Syntrophocurvum alkaliphilum]